MFRDARHGSCPPPPPPPRIAIPEVQKRASTVPPSSSAPSNLPSPMESHVRPTPGPEPEAPTVPTVPTVPAVRARSEAGGSPSDGDEEMTLVDAEEREGRFPKMRRVDKACNFCRKRKLRCNLPGDGSACYSCRDSDAACVFVKAVRRRD